MHFLKDFIIKFYFLLNFIVGLYALLVFQISYSADIKHWLGGFLALSVPLAFAANIFFLLSYVFYRSWKFILSLLVLVLGYPLLERTVKFNLTKTDSVSTNGLSMLSYNVMYCANGMPDAENISRGLVMDLDTLTADIKCIQELYNKPNHPFLNTIDRLKENNPHYSFMQKGVDANGHIGGVGLATFSKYPIVHKDEVAWKINNNGVLITDIKVNEDTIRVFNVQFKSMGIRVQKAITRDEEVLKKETRNILSQLKSGFEDRAIQVDKLEELVLSSPYPVLVAGDFNELPYGYAYGRIREHLENGFERKGFGFGFTYHKILSFLRIDNLFYDVKAFDILSFITLREHSYSDHYPIWAKYEIK